MSVFVTAPIVTDALLAEVAHPGCGATSVFLGTVRNGPDEAGHGGVTGIDYSAYEAMAVPELERIVAEAGARWPGVRVVVRHRLGLVPAGEASIGIAVAAPHRAAACDACRYVIDETKRRVPIWKRERHADGTVDWVEPGHPPVPSAR